MEISIDRFNYSPNSTIGRLNTDGTYYCYSLELPWKGNEHEVSCIVPGRYKVRIDYSKHFNAPLPHLLDVPGRDMIRIHPANWPRQLLGCIAPGETYGVDSVNASRDAFAPLFGRIKSALERNEEVWIEIKGNGGE